MYNHSTLHPDQKYIHAIATGDNVLVQEMYDKFRPLIQKLILQNRGTLADAYDLFQDLMETLCKNCHRIVLKGRIDNYLYVVSFNQWRTQLGKKKAFAKVLIPLVKHYVESSTIDFDELLYQERLHLFEQKVIELSASSQELLLLRLMGVPPKEVARLLGKTHASCRTKQTKIKARLTNLVKSAAGQQPELFSTM